MSALPPDLGFTIIEAARMVPDSQRDAFFDYVMGGLQFIPCPTPYDVRLAIRDAQKHLRAANPPATSKDASTASPESTTPLLAGRDR
jgi:hypothetical protein